MKIKSITGFKPAMYTPGFGRKLEKAEACEDDYNDYSKRTPISKLVPALVALSGMTTLNSCQEDFSYSDMESFKNSYFESVSQSEKELSKTDDKTYVFSEKTDSLYKETDDYKYSHIRITGPKHTTVSGNIERKQDGKKLKFVNVYNKDNVIESSILKDPATKETFFVTYSPDGNIEMVHDKNGQELPSAKYKVVASVLLLILALGGLLLPEKKSRD